jgi:hypothetical protein
MSVPRLCDWWVGGDVDHAQLHPDFRGVPEAAVTILQAAYLNITQRIFSTGILFAVSP